MKIILTFLLFSASLNVLAADCWSIKDNDSRAYCRVKETRSRGQCVAIKDYPGNLS